MRKQCAIEKKCGGCQFINKGYEASLEYKNKKMKKLFEEFHVNVHPIEGAKNPYGYRNKTIVAFDHQYHYGLYEESSHRVVPYDTCLLHDEKTDQILKKISQLFRKYRVSIYDPRKSRGDIRHVLIRRAVKTDQTLVTLVSNNKVFNGSKNFCKEMTKAFPDIKSIVLNVNQRKTSIVLGDYEKVLYGKGFIIDELCGLTFKISSKSFYQINHDQCEALYDKTLSLLKNPQKVLDTYCGIGTIGMIASKKAKEVIGVERNRDAIKDANDNKASNHINNIKFICDDATEFMKKQASMKASYDTIIMDPPRTGSTKEFIQAVKILNPKQIVYVSCGPDTQVRDLKEFKKIGYTFTDVYPFDMFPFTEHVETVALLSKLSEAKHHIEVKVDMDELDLTSKEAKATYKEIQDWVQEKYGFHVTNLNIAQVKQKHGIIERENYNKAKSTDSKQPGCPEEKVKAIEDAMRHFQMIESQGVKEI